MFKRIIHFIKYNNAMVLILALIFVAGSGVFAQTETGQELIGEKTTRIEGIDNTLLLEADLEAFDMDFRIERIEEDEAYFYAYYTCLDLVQNQGVWEYELNEKVRPVSKKLKSDLGAYLAEELGEEYQARLKELKAEKAKAESEGGSVRIEVAEYSGLIGQVLSVTERVFPGYEAVKTRQLPSPDPALTLPLRKTGRATSSLAQADDLTLVYEEYIARMDPDGDDVFGEDDNCPDDYNPKQNDEDGDGLGDACDFSFTMPEEDGEQTTVDPEESQVDNGAGSEQTTEGGEQTTVDSEQTTEGSEQTTVDGEQTEQTTVNPEESQVDNGAGSEQTTDDGEQTTVNSEQTTEAAGEEEVIILDLEEVASPGS